MDKKRLGQRIKAARRDRGLTGEKLAELCNINATYLRQIEGGTKTPSLPVFATICKELKVSPNYLLPDLADFTESNDMDIIIRLWNDATPGQIRMITAMLKSALDSQR